MDPDLPAVAEAVPVEGGLQGAVIEHAETAVPGGVGLEEGVDVCDGLVQLLADALREVAFGEVGRGDLVVVELRVGDGDDLSAVCCLGREGAVEVRESLETFCSLELDRSGALESGSLVKPFAILLALYRGRMF